MKWEAALISDKMRLNEESLVISVWKGFSLIRPLVVHQNVFMSFWF
jgi:hypothetical protein